MKALTERMFLFLRNPKIDQFYPSQIKSDRLLFRPSQSPPSMLMIDPSVRWNHTGVQLQRGRRYRIRMPIGQRWRDLCFKCRPEGYTNLLVAPFTPFLRVRGAQRQSARFFTRIGTIGGSTQDAFIIGGDGELVCFANAVPWANRNNYDSIKIDLESLGH